MYHSITFGDKNTWTDWHLVPSSRPVINPPKPKVQYVDIPGADGSIDITESLAGRPVFEDREGSLDFIVLNDFNVDNYNYNWIDVYTSIMQYLHGRRMKMILEDDPNYYYDGRFTVNSWKSDQNNSTITIDYRVSPYKYEVMNAITAADFEIGAVIDGGSEDDNLTYKGRLKAPPLACSKGDSIRTTREFLMDVALYDGTAENPAFKQLIFAAYLNGNGYTFKDSGFFRINLYQAADAISGRTITQEDLEAMAASVTFFKGGVL